MIIGLVGGVGCGKSTVLNYLRDKYEAYIIEADKVTKELTEKGNPIYCKIIEEFQEAVGVDGDLDRDKLASIVFKDEEKLSKLNSITHPETIKEIKSRICNSDAKIIVVESALLVGTGIEKMCDEIWFVYCDREIRIKRLMEKRNYTREKIMSIIDNQMFDDEFNKVADEFINNSNTPNETREQIDFILNSQFC